MINFIKTKLRHIFFVSFIIILISFVLPTKVFAANNSVLSFASGSSVLSATGTVASTTSSIFLTAGIAQTTYTFYWDSTITGKTVTLGTCSTAAAATTCSLANFIVPHSSKGAWKIHNEASAVASSNVLTYTVNSTITGTSSTSGNVGSSLIISGTGFAAETVTGKIGTNSIGTGIVSSGTGTNKGDLTINGTIPAMVKGTYAISASGATSGNISSGFTYTVNPNITLSSTSGISNSSTSITGTGYGASLTVTVVFDGVNTATTSTSNATGGFLSLNYTVTGSVGTHTINVKDSAGNTATNITYTITSTLGISSSATTTLSGVTLNGGIGSSTGGLGTITVTDNRGTNVGWSLTVTSSDFINGSKTIPVTNLNINPNNSTFSVSSGTSTGVSISSSHTFISTSDIVSILTASFGNGNGVYSINPGLNLSVPVNTYSGTYSSTIVETLQ